MNERFAGIILAAGLSERFGSPKILVDWHGRSLIRHVAESVIACDFSTVIIVVGAIVEPARKALSGCPVELIENSQYRSGLGTSFSAGVSAIQDEVDGSFVFLCDHPFIDEKLIAHMKSISDQADVFVPIYHNSPGHPVLWNRNTFSRIRKMKIGETGHSLQREFNVLKVPWLSNKITFDIDTPTDYGILLNTVKDEG